ANPVRGVDRLQRQKSDLVHTRGEAAVVAILPWVWGCIHGAQSPQINLVLIVQQGLILQPQIMALSQKNGVGL
ncbi:hypothetical protein, partial [Aeromonas caviae]|uniref:hypothetical protein n=1 Tax=Aeromonas caviae TaxID=648 RepID=UPI0029D7A5F3